jgi:hypothetical protein
VRNRIVIPAVKITHDRGVQARESPHLGAGRCAPADNKRKRESTASTPINAVEKNHSARMKSIGGIKPLFNCDNRKAGFSILAPDGRHKNGSFCDHP